MSNDNSHADIRDSKMDGKGGKRAASNKNNAQNGVNRWKDHKVQGFNGNNSHRNTQFQSYSAHSTISGQLVKPYQMEQGHCDELSRLCTKLRSFVQSSGSAKCLLINLSNSAECSRWIQLWSISNVHDKGLEYLLPIVMLVLPDSQDLMPAIEDVVQVLSTTVSRLKDDSGMRPEDALRILESVVDVIKSRLAGKTKSIMKPESVMASLGILILYFTETAIKFFSSFRERVLTLLKREEEIKNYQADVRRYQSFLNSTDACKIPGDNSECILSAQGWSTPTVGWLLSDKWHNVRPLKTQYKDSDEYARTLEEVWTLLTFYWGAAAMRPKCQHVQKGVGEEDKFCSEPLLQLAKGGCCSNKRGGIQCSRLAEWKCHRFKHDEICVGCLAQKREQLIGPPGPYASTDIYDAVVERETTRREGSVYLLTALRSRKPPSVAPNWNTTYRLQPAALVAVVRLEATNQRLPQNSP